MVLAATGDGYLYHLLRFFGAGDHASRTAQDLLVRPVEIVVVVALTLGAATLGARLIRRTLSRVGRHAAGVVDAPRARSRMATLGSLLASVWKVLAFVTGAIVVLGVLGLNPTPFLAGATVVGATIGFGAQSLVRDYLSGVLIALEDQFGIGDIVELPSLSITGTVEEVRLRVTRLRDVKGAVWFVANGDLRAIANHSRDAQGATGAPRHPPAGPPPTSPRAAHPGQSRE